MTPVRTAARALLGAIFVASGVRSIANPERLVPQAKRVTDQLVPLLERTDPRLPTETRSLIKLNGAVQLVGGLLLNNRRLSRPAAVALAASLVPTTIAGHPFWAYDQPERRNHETQFLKNLGLLGGLLLAAADTQGRPSLRYRAGTFVDRQQRSVRHAAALRQSTLRHAVDKQQTSLQQAVRSGRRAVQTSRRHAKIAGVSAAVARRLPG